MIDEMTRACLAIASRCSRSSLSRASSTSSSRMVRCACRAFCSCADSMHFTAMQAIRRWISSTPAKCATSKFVSASPPLTHSLSVCLTTPCFVVAPTAGNATTYAVTPFAGAILLHVRIFSTKSAHVFAACSLAVGKVTMYVSCTAWPDATHSQWSTTSTMVITQTDPRACTRSLSFALTIVSTILRCFRDVLSFFTSLCCPVRRSSDVLRGSDRCAAGDVHDHGDDQRAADGAGQRAPGQHDGVPAPLDLLLLHYRQLQRVGHHQHHGARWCGAVAMSC